MLCHCLTHRYSRKCLGTEANRVPESCAPAWHCEISPPGWRTQQGSPQQAHSPAACNDPPTWASSLIRFSKGAGSPSGRDGSCLKSCSKPAPAGLLPSSTSWRGLPSGDSLKSLSKSRSVNVSIAVAACSRSLSLAWPKSDNNGSGIVSASLGAWGSAGEGVTTFCSSSFFFWASFSFWNFLSISLTLRAPEYFFFFFSLLAFNAVKLQTKKERREGIEREIK